MTVAGLHLINQGQEPSGVPDLQGNPDASPCQVVPRYANLGVTGILLQYLETTDDNSPKASHDQSATPCFLSAQMQCRNYLVNGIPLDRCSIKVMGQIPQVV